MLNEEVVKRKITDLEQAKNTLLCQLNNVMGQIEALKFVLEQTNPPNGEVIIQEAGMEDGG
jgi:hypothetical protein